jgi:hypothetical protein
MRVTTRSRLGTKAINCPPVPGLKRASAGMPSPAPPVKRAGNSQPWEKLCASRPNVWAPVMSCVGMALSCTNHYGMTCRWPQRPPRSMQ